MLTVKDLIRLLESFNLEDEANVIFINGKNSVLSPKFMKDLKTINLVIKAGE